VRALAVTTPTRSVALPELPTVGDFVPGYDTSLWWGVGAPKNTPAEIVAKLNREINLGLAGTRIRERFTQLGAEVFPSSPADFSQLIAADIEKWVGLSGRPRSRRSDFLQCKPPFKSGCNSNASSLSRCRMPASGQRLPCGSGAHPASSPPKADMLGPGCSTGRAVTT
jgi:Tripartite tricarboxylate transporter family receptor